MNTPRVLDAQGREIGVGSRVTRPMAELVGRVESIEQDGTVWARFKGWPVAFDSRRTWIFRRWLVLRSYTCPDLLLVQKGPTE